MNRSLGYSIFYNYILISLSVADASTNKQENLPLNPFLSLLCGATGVVLASVTCGHLETVILPQDTAV